MADETPKKSNVSLMSKKRLSEIKDAIVMRHGEDGIDELMNQICEIMKFDPGKKTYDPEKGKYFMEWRKKRAEELGVTTGRYNAGVKTT
jgi:hypothetical protein